MAIVVESVVTYNGDSGVKTHNVTMPSDIQPGDQLIAFVRRASGSSGALSASGWNINSGSLFAGRVSPHNWVVTRVADGSEGATQAFVLSAARRLVAVVYRISGADPTRISVAWGGDQSSDPPQVTAAWGSAANLFFAGVATSASNQTFSAPPANYGNQVTAANGSNSVDQRCAITTARRAFTSGSDNPGVFDISGALIEPESFTVVIGPLSAGGQVPQGAVTISGVTPAATTAEVTYSYNNTDQTGFEYRLDGGAAANIGASPATITGLAAETPYDLQIRAINANGAGVWSTVAQFTTGAISGAPPQGTTTIGTISVTSNSARVPWSYDNTDFDGAECRFRVSAGAFGDWINVGLVSPFEISSLDPETSYDVEVRTYNSNGAGTAASAPFTTAATPPAGTITIGSAAYPIRNSANSVANESGVRINVMRADTLESLLHDVGLVITAGILVIPNVPASTGTECHVVAKFADGSIGVSAVGVVS